MTGDRILPWTEAKRLKAINPAARWRDVADAFGGDVWPRITPGFKIRPGQTVFTIGSCFARNIERHLELLGCRVPMLDFTLPPHEWDGQPSSALNRFHPPSFRQTLAWAHAILSRDGKVNWPDCEAMAFEVEAGQFFDLDIHCVCPVTRERFVERRQQIFEVMATAFSADCVMMTPGLIEAWRDRTTGLFIHATPLLKPMVADRSRWELVILSYETCLRDLLGAIDLLRTHNPEVPVLLTTSPVPMTVTFSGDDIRVANAHSKAVLRAVCGSAATLRPRTDYFPSYESVTQSPPEGVWKADRIHVSQGFIGRIVGHMFDHYLEEVDEGDRRHQEAVALLASGEFAQAETAARAALAARPDHVGARAVLAELLLRNGQWTLAESELRIAAAKDPDRVELKVGLARAIGADPARLPLALAMLEEIVGGLAVSLFDLLIIFDFIRKRAPYEAASERILRRSIELFPLNRQTHQPLIDMLTQQGRLDEAIELLRRSVEVAPVEIGLYLQLGRTLAAAGRRQEAMDFLEHTLRHEPRNAAAKALLASLSAGEVASAVRPAPVLGPAVTSSASV